ncbi:hypothetical protein WJX79_000999 [Trebouxia sp. C0005]
MLPQNQVLGLNKHWLTPPNNPSSEQSGRHLWHKFILRRAVDDEGFKLRDLKLKQATLMLAICFGIVWIIYSGIWGRSSGNPPTG